MSDPPAPQDLQRLLDEEPFVRSLVRSLFDDEVDDVVQQAYLQALERGTTPVHAARPWFARIVRNAARNLRRSIERRRTHESIAAARSTAIPSPEELVEREERRRSLVSAVNELPGSLRTVVLLRYFEALPPREIARELGMPVATIWNRLRRAHALLREQMDAWYGGNRRAWLLPLAPLAVTRPAPPWTPVTEAPHRLIKYLVPGAIAMTVKLKVAVLGGVLALGAVGTALFLELPVPPRAGEPPIPTPLPATTAQADAVEVPEENIARSPETNRHPVPSALGPARGTSLLVRVVERGTGTPVPDFGASLLPENSSWENTLDGASNDQGEILWKNIAFNPVRIFPSPTRDWFTLEKGQLNERVHEVEFLFSVQGVVVDARDQPVPGAEVWQSLDTMELVALSKVAVTDSRGSFFFRVHASRRVSVFARSAGMAPSRIAFVSQPVEGQSVQLRLGIGDEPGAIVGDVVSPDGSPIEGARVQVRGSPQSLPPQVDPNFTIPRRDFAPLSNPVRTDVMGKFRFEDVPVGEATLTVFVETWAGAVAKVEVIPGGRSQVRVTMSRGVRIAGTVRNTRGEPLGGVALSATRHRFAGRHSVSDGRGQYVLEGVQPGAVQLEARDPVRGTMNDRVELADGEEYRWDPVFGADASIQGVILYDDGVPLSDRPMLVLGEDGERRRIQTDAEGRFTVPHCKDQAYEITAYPPGFPLPVSLATDVRPGEKELILRLPRLPATDAYLVGRVLDAGGHPVSPVKISGREKEHSNLASQTTSPDGRFRLGPVPSGAWSFSFESSGHPTVEREITLRPGEARDLGDINLEEAVPLEVLVRDTGGPQGRVTAYLWGPGIEDLRVVVDSGRVAFPPLQAGGYRVEFAGEYVPREVREFELVNGRETRIDIDLESGVSRSLAAVLPDGMESSVLQFTTFDSVGRELVSWHRRWFSYTVPLPFGFRSQAVRIVASTEDGLRAEAVLGPVKEIRLVLR